MAKNSKSKRNVLEDIETTDLSDSEMSDIDREDDEILEDLTTSDEDYEPSADEHSTDSDYPEQSIWTGPGPSQGSDQRAKRSCQESSADELTDLDCPEQSILTGPGPSQGSDQRAKRSCVDLQASFRDEDRWRSVDEMDEASAKEPVFHPRRQPGFHGSLPESIRLNPSPLDIFLLFFSMDMLKELCGYMEAYVAARRERGEVGDSYQLPKNFGPVTFLSFIGFLMYAGMHKFPTLHDYFRRNRFVVPFIQNGHLSRTAITNIMGSLRFSSATEDEEVASKQQASKPYDRLHKVRWLIDHIKQASSRLFAPQQKFSIHERMVACKTKFSSIKAKPSRWGFKLWVLACPRTGYTHNFDVYVGKANTGSGSGKGLSYDVVQNLLKDDFLNCGHIVYMDSFYSSQVLFEDLVKQGTHAVGTVRPSRRGYPTTQVNSLESRSQQGEIRWYRNGVVVYIQWMDSRVVNVASTIHIGHATATKEKKVRDRKTGAYVKRCIPVPKVILDYNRNMRGVDLSDQLIQYYDVARITRAWYKKFFFHCIDIAVMNSLIIFNELRQGAGLNRVNQLTFRRTLLEQLWDLRAEALPPTVVLVIQDVHRLVRGKSRKDCAVCSKRSRRHRTYHMCFTCNVHLCSKDCSDKYHGSLIQ